MAICPHDWQPLVPPLPRDDPRYADQRLGLLLDRLADVETCPACGRLRNGAGMYSNPEIEAAIRRRADGYMSSRL